MIPVCPFTCDAMEGEWRATAKVGKGGTDRCNRGAGGRPGAGDVDGGTAGVSSSSTRSEELPDTNMRTMRYRTMRDGPFTQISAASTTLVGSGSPARRSAGESTTTVSPRTSPDRSPRSPRADATPAGSGSPAKLSAGAGIASVSPRTSPDRSPRSPRADPHLRAPGVRQSGLLGGIASVSPRTSPDRSPRSPRAGSTPAGSGSPVKRSAGAETLADHDSGHHNQRFAAGGRRPHRQVGHSAGELSRADTRVEIDVQQRQPFAVAT